MKIYTYINAERERELHCRYVLLVLFGVSFPTSPPKSEGIVPAGWRPGERIPTWLRLRESGLSTHLARRVLPEAWRGFSLRLVKAGFV